MEDYQFAELMKVLKEINHNLSELKDALPSESVYDLGDVCGKIDEVRRAVESIDVG